MNPTFNLNDLMRSGLHGQGGPGTFAVCILVAALITRPWKGGKK